MFAIAILQVVDEQSGKAAKKTKLRVFSFTHKRDKILAGDVLGRFTTDPKLSAFHIPDLMKYVPNPFPVSVRLFLDEETAQQGLLPEVLTRDPVLLLDSTIETCLVATCELSEEGSGPTNSSVVEIPMTQDVLVSFLSDTPRGQSNSLETLHTKTLTLWKLLLSGGANVAVTRLGDSSNNPAQRKLSKMVHKAWERECQALKAPPRLLKDLRNPTEENSETAQVYQALTTDAELESHYTAIVSSSLANSDYEDAESLDLEDNPFTSDHEKVCTQNGCMKD